MKRGFLNSAKAKKEAIYPTPTNQTQIHPTSSGQVGQAAATLTGDGKTEVISFPEDRHPNAKNVEYDSNKMTYTGQYTAISRIPGQPCDPDGYSQWIVNGPTKDKILNAPGYPCPVPKPRRPNMYVVKSTPGMGMGVFAACDIELGELIFSERPLLVVPRAMKTHTVYPTHYSAEKIKELTLSEWEVLIETAVGRMWVDDQKAFKGLMNNWKDGGSRPLLGIVMTNSFGLENLADGPDDPEKETPGEAMYGAIGKVGSRINHSCMPNLIQTFKRSSFSLQFSATRDIKAGEQLFVSYCTLSEPVAVRRKDLAPYGFVCQCSACANATPATDRLRQEYMQKIDRYAVQCKGWLRGPKLSVKVLDPLLKLWKDMLKEGIDTKKDYRRLLTIIQMVYLKLGMQKEAALYSQELRRYAKIAEDEN